jgi:hypothetical protein
MVLAKIVNLILELMKLEKYAELTHAMTLFKSFWRMEHAKLVETTLILMKNLEHVLLMNAIHQQKSY